MSIRSVYRVGICAVVVAYLLLGFAKETTSKSIQKRVSPEETNQPETNCLRLATLHGGHGSRFHFNVKREAPCDLTEMYLVDERNIVSIVFVNGSLPDLRYDLRPQFHHYYETAVPRFFIFKFL